MTPPTGLMKTLYWSLPSSCFRPRQVNLSPDPRSLGTQGCSVDTKDGTHFSEPPVCQAVLDTEPTGDQTCFQGSNKPQAGPATSSMWQPTDAQGVGSGKGDLAQGVHMQGLGGASSRKYSHRTRAESLELNDSQVASQRKAVLCTG